MRDATRRDATLRMRLGGTLPLLRQKLYPIHSATWRIDA